MKNISQLRAKTGLSQSEFAKKYNISVRTLQQWEQGISSPLASFIQLIEKEINRESNLRNKYVQNNSWKVTIEDPFTNCEKVYPIQQRKVKALIDDLSNQVDKIIIFGSSITNRCHIGSDIDIYVETNSDKIKTGLYDFEYDFWTNKTVDSRLKKEILNKGVVVYERS